MTRFERWTMHSATALVGGTGLIYAYMLYALETPDEFTVLHHPQQGAVQHLHVLCAPLLVFAVGMIFRDHAWRGFRLGGREHRLSGVTLLASSVPMIASGYLLQTASDETWRRVWVGIHLIAGGLWLAGYLAHGLTRRRHRRHDAGAA